MSLPGAHATAFPEKPRHAARSKSARIRGKATPVALPHHRRYVHATSKHSSRDQRHAQSHPRNADPDRQAAPKAHRFAP